MKHSEVWLGGRRLVSTKGRRYGLRLVSNANLTSVRYFLFLVYSLSRVTKWDGPVGVDSRALGLMDHNRHGDAFHNVHGIVLFTWKPSDVRTYVAVKLCVVFGSSVGHAGHPVTCCSGVYRIASLLGKRMTLDPIDPYDAIT